MSDTDIATAELVKAKGVVYIRTLRQAQCPATAPVAEALEARGVMKGRTCD
ncbi:MAG: hypothetical protein HOB84_00850 [Candidatus Marinimicrobia bacterium]|nr:hypothetical protein [Candidatus Neomarinimicrobiota bacterium]MBT4362686.1 hypothetical protein [Candidatus Neomarinimicrobiota bacterium]MBT4713304.1 hypothetical protein [Candidatus Neomarinimicrobiota bacterium]MBT4944825.1 hypothetical protein [Candidatus Neomarinimicrobiota bacterium]MBT5271661.1 hypothetical protein [Candidatus Neomarinimicrobiota bacterium]